MTHLTQSEVRELLRLARDCRERDWLMILVAYWHGLRASEVVRLTAGQIEDGHITVQRLKGSLKTCQPLVAHGDELLDEATALSRYAAELPSGERLFPISRVQFWRLFQQYGEAAGIPKRLRHPHVLKHSCAMTLVDKTDINVLQRWLGHKSMASTGEYTKVSDEAAGAAVTAAIAKAKGAGA